MESRYFERRVAELSSLGIMITVVRALSFAVGVILLLAPLALGLGFAYGVGEPPTTTDSAWFAGPLLVAGVLIGGGPMLVGIPGVVVGHRRPLFQSVAAVMLSISALAILWIGFSGRVTAIAGPVVLLIEAAAFYFFVYPAARYSDAPIPNTEL